MKRTLLILSLVLMSCCAAVAQGYSAPQVEISTEKARIGGKLFYVHKVEARQTIYAICKAYGINQKELAEANPSLNAGSLKAGSFIFIPVKHGSQISQQVSQDIPDSDPSEKIAETEIEVNQQESSIQDSESGKQVSEVIEHRVKWYETLPMIARKYKIPEKIILSFNGLEESEVVKGTVLQIPMYGTSGAINGQASVEDPGTFNEGDATAVTVAGTAGDATDGEYGQEEAAEPEKEVVYYDKDNPLHISLVLPFNASGEWSVNMMDFYCGALLAVEEQKKAGRHMVLNVFDLSVSADKILSDDRFEQSDLIIGPVKASSLAPFADFAKERDIAFVSPMDHKADVQIANNSCFFQVPPSAAVQTENMIDGLNYEASDQVLVFHDATRASDSYLNDIKELLERDDIKYKLVGYDIHQGRELFVRLKRTYNLDRPTKVIVASEDEAFASDVIRNLDMLANSSENSSLQVFCSNRVRSFETIDGNALYHLSANVSAPYFIDYSDAGTRSFLRKYRALFNTEPNSYSFQGYDIFTYFISAMSTLGSEFADKADTFPMKLLQCSISFERQDEKSGWSNTSTRNLHYKNGEYTISVD